jgi:hypothetical protein
MRQPQEKCLTTEKKVPVSRVMSWERDGTTYPRRPSRPSLHLCQNQVSHIPFSTGGIGSHSGCCHDSPPRFCRPPCSSSFFPPHRSRLHQWPLGWFPCLTGTTAAARQSKWSPNPSKPYLSHSPSLPPSSLLFLVLPPTNPPSPKTHQPQLSCDKKSGVHNTA